VQLRPWLPVFAYMGLIFLLSSLPLTLEGGPRLPMRDKLAHLFEFAGLGYLCARAALQSFPDRAPLRAALVGVLVAAAWGVADELHQAFVPTRTADALDLLADALGASLGAGLRLAQVRLGASRAVAE